MSGVSAVRNWIVQRFTEEAIVMLDDDITACVCMVSLRCRKLSPDETLAMLENSAYCARGAGARLFGWHQRSDPRLLQRNDPFGDQPLGRRRGWCDRQGDRNGMSCSNASATSTPR